MDFLRQFRKASPRDRLYAVLLFLVNMAAIAAAVIFFVGAVTLLIFEHWMSAALLTVAIVPAAMIWAWSNNSYDRVLDLGTYAQQPRPDRERFADAAYAFGIGGFFAGGLTVLWLAGFDTLFTVLGWKVFEPSGFPTIGEASALVWMAAVLTVPVVWIVVRSERRLFRFAPDREEPFVSPIRKLIRRMRRTEA